ncbi:MAG: YHS domain-containing protein [Pseudomonadota bacterium]
MPNSRPTEVVAARELDLTLVIADLSGYTALTEAHGALRASEIVLRFVRLVEASCEPGVALVNSTGDEVFCTAAATLAGVRSALKLRDAVEREPGFPRIRTGIHRGAVVERAGRLFGAPINLTARLAGQARGGQILCTEPIAQAVRTLATIEARPIGKRRFRNVAHPVAVFELVRVGDRRVAAAIDPVCRMQVALARAAESIVHEGKVYRFCSLECARAFAAAPELYTGSGGL